MISTSEIQQDERLKIYFNWTANALMPIYTHAADLYIKKHRETIVCIAQQFLSSINDLPETIYRGIIMKEPTTCLMPHRLMKYLSFSTDINVAKHFADVNGFGSDVVDLKKQLGEYGYLIEYKPTRTEILFHYAILDILPYSEVFSLMGLDGDKEVSGLKKQREIMIQQPETPFVNIKPFKNETATMPTRRSKQPA